MNKPMGKPASLKRQLIKLFNLPEQGDVFLHFLQPLEKSSRAEGKLYTTLVCKVYFKETTPRHYENTGYVGKILLSLPYFVLYSMPASGYIFLKKLANSPVRETQKHTVGARGQEALGEALDQFLQYRIFDHIGRSSDMTNHQYIMLFRFLARTEANSRLFRTINTWNFFVDSFLLSTSFEDFEIQEELNIARTFSLDTLERCMENIQDSFGAPIFNLSFETLCMNQLYFNFNTSGNTTRLAPRIVTNDEDFYVTNAKLISATVSFRQNYPDSVFVGAIRKLWHSLFSMPKEERTMYPALGDFLFNVCTFDIEVGSIPLEQCKSFFLKKIFGCSIFPPFLCSAHRIKGGRRHARRGREGKGEGREIPHVSHWVCAMYCVSKNSIPQRHRAISRHNVCSRAGLLQFQCW